MAQLKGTYNLSVLVYIEDGKLCGKVHTNDKRNVELQHLPYETRKMILNSMREFLNRWDKRTVDFSFGADREIPAMRPLFGPEKAI
jgi:hypothetical protein